MENNLNDSKHNLLEFVAFVLAGIGISMTILMFTMLPMAYDDPAAKGIFPLLVPMSMVAVFVSFAFGGIYAMKLIHRGEVRSAKIVLIMGYAILLLGVLYINI